MDNILLPFLNFATNRLYGTGIGVKHKNLFRLYKILRRSASPSWAMIGKNKIYLDRDDIMELSSGIGINTPLVRLLRRFLNDRSVAVDVGAHIGFITIVMAEKIGFKGKVYAFEPGPQSFQLLKKNIAVNKFNNVLCYELALGNQKGEKKLYLNPENSGNNFLFSSPLGRHFESVIVSVEKLDNVLKNLAIDLIKIDVEGYELFVLKGAENTFKRNKNILVIAEYCPEHLMAAGTPPGKLMKYMKDLGFNSSLMDELSGRLININNLSLADINQQARGNCNLLFSRNPLKLKRV